MWWESVAVVDARAVAHRAAGDRVRAFAETLQDFVAAPIAQSLRDQKNLILRQRFTSRFRHPHTTPSSMTAFKLKRSCSFFYRRRARRQKGVIALAHAPETASVSPVTQRDSSDAKNTATGAISSGCPVRPSGVRASHIQEIAMADGRKAMPKRKVGLSMVLSLYLRSTLSIIFFQSLDKFGGAFEEPFLRLEDRTRPMRR
jgi:hypothetical protein